MVFGKERNDCNPRYVEVNAISSATETALGTLDAGNSASSNDPLMIKTVPVAHTMLT